MEQDIFDKIMNLPGLKNVNPFYKKYKEALMYLFFGGLAFFLNIILFCLIDRIISINALINNIICWIICVFFQFFTNRQWVFNCKVKGKKEFLKQLFNFICGRLFTLAVEEIILAIFIIVFSFDRTMIKLFAQIIVIVLNYIISKWIIFNKKERNKVVDI